MFLEVTLRPLAGSDKPKHMLVNINHVSTVWENNYGQGSLAVVEPNGSEALELPTTATYERLKQDLRNAADS